MQNVDLSKPGEKKKLIWAGILGLVAILFLWWTFVGFGTSKPTPPRTEVAQGGSRGASPKPGQEKPDQSAQLATLTTELQEISLEFSRPDVQEPKRNIFAYYEPPPVEKVVAQTPTPTPTPTPPVLLAALSPANVYARTADFTLEVSGDKFTPETHIFVDGRELPTKYRSPQQLSAVVPATIIANPGSRQISVRTSDGRLYSGQSALTVAAPPIPNYNYIGIIDTTTRVSTALLQDKTNKEILNVQRGDVLSGRFRVTSISEKELVLMDTNLKIKHSIAMSEGDRSPGSPLTRPTPRVDAEDDEP